ncbi:MAG: hypothetical protein JW839_07810 [Candidatus Lokiarchaeota archaeon]|nr:hypothetical protein [Candidatus Lokiarchaeota archaeon]
MGGTQDPSTANKLIVVFFSAAAWFFALGIFTYAMTPEVLIDLMIIGLIALVLSALHVFVPRRFKIHVNGIITFVLLTLLLITITNVTIQIFLIFFVAANMIYIVFYLGVYTACIDQAREDGISNDDYIKDFNLQARKEDAHERGFLLKASKNAGDADA